MTDKPFALVKIDDLCANLRSTMARCPDVFAPSMRKQISQAVSAYLRMRLAGEPFIHPGMTKMAKWGQCKERQARYNFSQMRLWGIVEVVAYPKGGRRASRFVVNFSALKALLVEMGANPSQALFDKISEAGNPAINPAVISAENPAMDPAMSAAGIHTDRKAPAKGRIMPRLRIVGGRDA